MVGCGCRRKIQYESALIGKHFKPLHHTHIRKHVSVIIIKIAVNLIQVDNTASAEIAGFDLIGHILVFENLHGFRKQKTVLMNDQIGIHHLLHTLRNLIDNLLIDMGASFIGEVISGIHGKLQFQTFNLSHTKHIVYGFDK